MISAHVRLDWLMKPRIRGLRVWRRSVRRAQGKRAGNVPYGFTLADDGQTELGEQFRLLEAARAPEITISVPVFRFLAWGAFVGVAGRLMCHILWVQRRSRVLRLSLYALIALVLLVVALLVYLY